MKQKDIAEHNAKAWDEESIEESEWCTPVKSDTIKRAIQGDWQIKLTPKKYVPSEWLGDVREKFILCLGSGGGQQAPVLSAAGAHVVSLDISAEQLAKDEMVALRDGLFLRTVKGDMSDLSGFSGGAFDYIVSAVSNIFVPDIQTIWDQCGRVLVPGGTLITGIMNPSFFMFDHKKATDTGQLTVEYKLPYSDIESIPSKKLKDLIDNDVPIVFSHSLDEQIGGLIRAGFVINGFYEDWWTDEATPLNKYSPTTMVIRALKQGE